MSFRHSKIAVLSAHVPTRLVFSAAQIALFGTPLELEAVYAKYAAKIAENYVSTINKNLAIMWDKCQFSATRGAYTSIGSNSDVVNMNILKGATCIDLRNISVRPCFEGYGTLTLVIYQLLKIAYTLNIPFVCIRGCLPKTVAILKYKFEQFGIFEIDKYNDCFLCTEKLRLTASDLGIAHKIIESDESSSIQLDPLMFPTAAELNNDEYVETHFESNYPFLI